MIIYEFFKDEFFDLKIKFQQVFKTYIYFKQVILAPIFEEIFYRLFFFIVLHLQDMKFNLVINIIIAVVFSLSHFPDLQKIQLKEFLALSIMRGVFSLYSSYILYKS